MPLQATSGAASYDAFGGGAAAGPTYIEDVFSTYLYTGNGATQTINNGIDLAGKGGLTWIKARSAGGTDNALFDTNRGVKKVIFSNTTDAQRTAIGGTLDLYDFTSSGFSVGTGEWASVNSNTVTYASWTFRKQPKFFDVVTYTGTGSTQTIAHNLGSTPGCIMVKRTNTTGNWRVFHTSLGATKGLALNLTMAQDTATGYWADTAPTSTNFTVGNYSDVNASGSTYVAYLFAHDAGGFGLNGTDNVISCGSFTTDGSGNASVTLGYEPQWILWRNSQSAANWWMADAMRGLHANGNFRALFANLNNAEGGATGMLAPNATGFSTVGGTANWAANATHIYIAIRRGPMKVPTTGTSVFSPVVRAGTSANATVSTSFPVDMTMIRTLSAGTVNAFDRLRGPLLTLRTSDQVGDTSAAATLIGFDTPTGVKLGDDTSVYYVNTTGQNYINYLFSRAPNFLDVVCYTASGAGTTVTHNLGVTPEMVIIKNRGVFTDWGVWHKSISPSSGILFLNTGSLISTGYVGTRTSTTFAFLTSNSVTSASGNNYVAYFFATLPGVSKVGNYTGTGVGTTQQIDCGFTSGARFVLIKRASSSVSGDWYVWDTARGIVTGNDPFFHMNVFRSETTNTDYIDPYSAGFEISSTAPSQINESGNNYIFLAIA